MKKNLEKYMLENGETIFRKTKDGRKLRIAIWKTQKERVCGTIFFLNGHREFIEKYSETFALFVKKGCNVITFDWRGWGLSERPFPYQPKIQHISSAAEYQLDLDTVISLAKQKNLVHPWHLIAHSLGCLLGLRRLVLEPECFKKYIFLSPLWGNLLSLQIPLQRLLLRSEKILQFLNLTKVTNQNPKKYTPYSLTVDFRKNTLTSDKKQFQRLQTILKNNPELHSGAPTLGYLIAMLKEIDSLNRVDLPNRDMLVLLAEQERITDNKAVMRLIRRYDFINVVKINKAQHEILIEKETIRKKAMSLIHNFIDS
jgi:lysophospholipase